MKKIISIILAVAMMLAIFAGCGAAPQDYEPPVFGSHATEATETANFRPGDEVWCLRHGNTGYGPYAQFRKYRIIAITGDYATVTWNYQEGEPLADTLERVAAISGDENAVASYTWPIADCYATYEEAEAACDAENEPLDDPNGCE